MADRERNYLFDNLKCILIFAVVIGHFAERIVDYRSMKIIYTFVYTFHMPLFVFISGLFAERTLVSKQKVIKRSLGLILTTLFLKLIIYLANNSLKVTFAYEQTAAWYLYALAVYYPAAYVIRKIDKKYILILSMICSILIGYTNIGFQFNLSRIFVMFPFFVLGMMCNTKSIESFREKRLVRIAGVTVILVLLVCCVFFTDSVYRWKDVFRGCVGYEKLGVGVYGPLVRMTGYIVSTIIGAAFIVICYPKRVRAVSVIGQRTLQIFFWHCPLIYGGLRIGLFTNMSDTLQIFLYNGIWQIAYISIACAVVLILAIKLFGIPLRWTMNSFGVVDLLNEKIAQKQIKRRDHN